jgi:hypothetical protein
MFQYIITLPMTMMHENEGDDMAIRWQCSLWFQFTGVRCYVETVLLASDLNNQKAQGRFTFDEKVRCCSRNIP